MACVLALYTAQSCAIIIQKATLKCEMYMQCNDSKSLVIIAIYHPHTHSHAASIQRARTYTEPHKIYTSDVLSDENYIYENDLIQLNLCDRDHNYQKYFILPHVSVCICIFALITCDNIYKFLHAEAFRIEFQLCIGHQMSVDKVECIAFTCKKNHFTGQHILICLTVFHCQNSYI